MRVYTPKYTCTHTHTPLLSFCEQLFLRAPSAPKPGHELLPPPRTRKEMGDLDTRVGNFILKHTHANAKTHKVPPVELNNLQHTRSLIHTHCCVCVCVCVCVRLCVCVCVCACVTRV